jgi:hypothetical protein
LERLKDIFSDLKEQYYIFFKAPLNDTVKQSEALQEKLWNVKNVSSQIKANDEAEINQRKSIVNYLKNIIAKNEICQKELARCKALEENNFSEL